MMAVFHARRRKVELGRSDIPLALVTKRDRIAKARYDDYLNTYDNVTNGLALLDEKHGQSAKAYNFNPKMGVHLNDKGFDALTDEAARQYRTVGAFFKGRD